MLAFSLQFFSELDPADFIIVGAISIFTIVSIILFVAIVLSRLYHIRQAVHFEKNSETINNLLLEILFNDKNYVDLMDDKKLLRLFSIPQFRAQLMESVINLHQNYEGEYAESLRKFYVESQLMADSFVKLRNKNWEIKCKGIKELTEMNIKRAYEHLVELSKSNHPILKINALNGCIKINGPQGIIHLAKHKFTIDLWTQLNIIDALKKTSLLDTQNIELLLESKNNSVISLGLKIIHTFKLFEKQAFVEALLQHKHARHIQQEAENLLVNFNSYGKEIN
ncbi:hypothetical protein PQG46_12595 [Aquirufa nivalisilvae]|uniref:HEAT repeat domain-containing protein n=1 Tax=Aquirufa nivalisilvae TaxID=2516557 RepID=A0A2S2DUB1_9BACT|nr:hypothetical protein [Aquirufa nivalisilvae]AWL08953.1 hypothetical protein HME7025_01089 [Aquirufa nivalisilvae]